MPQTEDLNQSDPVQAALGGDIPCVDRRALDDSIDRVREAALDTGFFSLENVFPDPSVLGKVLRHMECFFALPDGDPVKTAVTARIDDRERGWTPLYQEPAYQPNTIAHVESFDCGRPALDGGQSANVWPAIPGFQRDVRQCWNVLATAGEQVLAALARAAGLETQTFAHRCNSHDLSTLRLLHYPVAETPETGKNVGIAAHTDFECITLLMQTAPGLELRDRQGNWLDAPPHGGEFIVLIDDMLERWTNGHFVATGHRVRRTNLERFSIVMFVAVNEKEVIAPREEFVTHENPAKFLPTTQRAHLYAEVDKAVRNRDKTGIRRD